MFKGLKCLGDACFGKPQTRNNNSNSNSNSNTNSNKKQALILALSRNKKKLAALSAANKNLRNRLLDPVTQNQMLKAAKYKNCMLKARNACIPAAYYKSANSIYKNEQVQPMLGESRSLLNNNARSKLHRFLQDRKKKPITTTNTNVAKNIYTCLRGHCLY